MLTSNKKRYFLVVLFFSFLAMSLLSPIASNRYLPSSPDFANQVGIISQASMALQEGQFPIRIAPWQHDGMRYPIFQFYSNLPYFVAGGLFWVLKPLGFDAFSIYKLVMFLTVMIAGIYFYKIAFYITRSPGIALLTGVLYMMSPYLLINLNVRGAFSESVAQGIIPLVLYYTLRLFSERFTGWLFSGVAIGWAALAMTHLITFVYTSLFMGLFIVFMQLRLRSNGKNFFIVGMAYIYGLFLSAWFLVPVLALNKMMNISGYLTNPWENRWLTPFLNLISMKALTPMPLPGNHELGFPLYPGIGWPVLVSVGLVIGVSYWYGKKGFPNKFNGWIYPLLILFILAFFMTWSPINFWSLFPQFLNIAQFSYRMLTQVMWIGALLSVFALSFIFKEPSDFKQLLVGILFIVIMNSSWLLTSHSSIRLGDNLMSIGYGQNDYLIKSEINFNEVSQEPMFSAVSQDGWLKLNTPFTMKRNDYLKGKNSEIILEGSFPAVLKVPVLFQLFLNRQIVFQQTLRSTPFVLRIPLRSLIDRYCEGNDCQLEFSTTPYFIPHAVDPRSSDYRHLSLQVQSVSLGDNFIPFPEAKRHCVRKGFKTICHFDISSDEKMVQLPILYYPSVLNIHSDQAAMRYTSTLFGDYHLLTVMLKKGSYHIEIYFRGVAWANGVSFISLIGIVLLVIMRRKHHVHSI